MTNKDILNIAMQQSAFDSCCDASDFTKSENKITISAANPNARKYLQLPLLCDFTSYGNNLVASISPPLHDIVAEYINKYSVESCFETPNLHMLIEKLKPFDMNVCFMAEYFLPDLTALKPISCNYETKVLGSSDLTDLYLPQWGNALCAKRKHLDVIAVGAYNNGQLIGLAGGSADCSTMWQIGIDVLPGYRRQGIATCLTSTLALEMLKKDIVPFYCCAWSNIKSARNAVKSGFKPAWIQATVKSNDFIAGLKL